MLRPKISHVWMGRQPYGQMLALQHYLVNARKAQKQWHLEGQPLPHDELDWPDVLLLVEHPHTFTSGRLSKNQTSQADIERLRTMGAQFYEVSRGGQLTYHGPGQLVGYPIVDVMRLLKGPSVLHRYVNGIEGTLIKTCAQYGVQAGRTKDTGVWVGEDKKIAALGIQLSFGISRHGFALNCTTDLAWFDNIVPCGLPDKTMTSLANETRAFSADDLEPVKVLDVVVQKFGEEFDVEMVPLDRPFHNHLIHKLSLML